MLEASVDGVIEQLNIYTIEWSSSVKLNFKIKNFNLSKMPYISLAVYDKEQRAIAEIHPESQDLKKITQEDEITFSILLKNIYLSKGIYNITFNASEGIGYNFYYKIHKSITLKIEHERQMWTSFLLDLTFIELNT